jgi:hypothetical protein
VQKVAENLPNPRGISLDQWNIGSKVNAQFDVFVCQARLDALERILEVLST